MVGPVLRNDFRIKLNTGLINLLRSIVCITLFLLTAFTAVVCTGKDISLTDQERAWLDRHKVITVGPAPDAPPFEFFDDKGSYRGMSADYLAWIGQQLGVRFKPVQAASWAELMNMARYKKVDLMTGIVSRDETNVLGSTIGGNRFLAKPVKSEELLEVIEEMTG